MARDDEILEHLLVQMHCCNLDTWMHHTRTTLKAMLDAMEAGWRDMTIKWLHFNHDWHAEYVQALVASALRLALLVHEVRHPLDV